MSSKRKRSNASNGAKHQNKRAKLSDPSHALPADVFSGAESTNSAPALTTTVFRSFPSTPVDLKKPIESLDIKERIEEAFLYDHLGNEDGAIRSAAALQILKGLLGTEKDGEKTLGVSQEELQRHLEKRLFAGLASGRNASRVGLSLVLTEMISQLFGGSGSAVSTAYPDITYDVFLNHLVKLNKTIGNVPSQQERDVFFGQLFGIECFVKAHVLRPEEPQRWYSLLNLALKLAERKVWLRPQCGWVIAQAFPQLDRMQVTATLERMAKEGLAKTPEAVGMLLMARKQFPDLEVKPWGNPLSAKGISDLASVLKENYHDDGSEVHESRRTKVPNATSQVHFAWDLLAEHFFNLGNDGAREFNSFWVRVVDDGLFSKTASNGQKLRGFLVFQKFMLFFSTLHSLLPVLFSRNLMSSLMNQAAKDDRFLHIAAQRALKSISDLAASDPQTVTVIIPALIGKNGSYAFDARTNSKTVEKTLQQTPASAAADIIELLESRLRASTGPGSEDAVAHLHAYVEYLYKLMDSTEHPDNKTLNRQTSAAALAIKKLALLSYVNAEKMMALGMTDKVKELCRTRLESAFAKFSRRTEDMTYLCHAVAAIDPSRFDFDDRIANELNEAHSQMEKLLQHPSPADESDKKKKSKKSKKEKVSESTAENENDGAVRKGLALMYAVSIFQLYNDDPDALNMFDDLKNFRTRSAQKGTDDVEDPAYALFVDILLSMVARPSSLARQVSKQVFEAFSVHVTGPALEVLFRVLKKSEDFAGYRELFDNADEMELEEIGEENSDAEEKDTEIVDIDDMSIDGEDGIIAQINTVNTSGDEEEDADSESPPSDEDDSDSPSEAEDDDEEFEIEDDGEDHEAFDKKLAALLRTHRADQDADASSDIVSDMTDSEMLALDETLSAAFRSRRSAMAPNRKVTAEAKETILNIKNRVLDLLDIFVRTHPADHRSFDILPALVTLVNRTGNKALASRSVDILLTHQKNLRKELTNRGCTGQEVALDVERLAGQLRVVHEAISEQKNNSNQFAKAASTASLAVASAMYAVSKESVETVVMEHGLLQTGWITGRVVVHASFFSSWLNWCQSRAQNNK